MKLTLRLTTYFKMLLLIIGICSLFLLLFLSLYLYTVQQEKDVFKANSDQYKKEVNRLFDFNSRTQIVIIDDLTYWDALVNFVKTKDTLWYNTHIENEFQTYDVDYIAVYGLDKKYIASTSKPHFKSNDFIPKQAMMHLYKNKFSRFFMQVPEGIIEVFGGTIHASDDPKKVKSKPAGYMFMARVLNKEYFKNLEDICSSKIQILGKIDSDTIGNKVVSSVMKLRNFDNIVVNKLLFERPSHLNFEKTKELLLIIVITTLITLIGAIHYSRKWVYKP